MRPSDLLILAANNLRRRKMRTVLTVLGVVIGTASIVVMVSLGLGQSRQMMELYQQSGSLTTISIYNWGGSTSASGEQLELTDDTIEDFNRLPHVTGATPVLQVYVQARCGIYEGGFQISGVSQDYLEQMELGWGELPKADQGELSLVYGNMIGMNFHKPKSDSWEPADIDPVNDTIFITFPQGYTQDTGNGSGGSAAAQKANKKYLIPVAGVVAGGPEDYNEFAYGAYCDLDTFKTFLKRIYKKNLVPNPATNKKGKPLPYYVYDTAYVFVDDMEHVSEVQKAISDMGYQADSNMQWLEQSQESMRMQQMVLGGIGAVSLFVAAIGIMNTMMMSIYERTKEIGVMKVLGCDMGDIRNMFLLESAIIGLMGGVAGLALSYGISAVINVLSGSGGMSGMGMFSSMGTDSGISYIPLWLAGFALVFAVGIGMIAGFVPAMRAMRLSPLAAIRNE